MIKLQERYDQTGDLVRIELPISCESARASAEGKTGWLVVRVNGEKSRTVVTRHVVATLDWSKVAHSDLVAMATRHWTASAGKPSMWASPHQEGEVDLGKIDMATWIADAKAARRAGAPKATKEEIVAEYLMKTLGVSLEDLKGLIADKAE